MRPEKITVSSFCPWRTHLAHLLKLDDRQLGGDTPWLHISDTRPSCRHERQLTRVFFSGVRHVLIPDAKLGQGRIPICPLSTAHKTKRRAAQLADFRKVRATYRLSCHRGREALPHSMEFGRAFTRPRDIVPPRIPGRRREHQARCKLVRSRRGMNNRKRCQTRGTRHEPSFTFWMFRTPNGAAIPQEPRNWGTKRDPILHVHATYHARESCTRSAASSSAKTKRFRSLLPKENKRKGCQR